MTDQNGMSTQTGTGWPAGRVPDARPPAVDGDRPGQVSDETVAGQTVTGQTVTEQTGTGEAVASPAVTGEVGTGENGQSREPDRGKGSVTQRARKLSAAGMVIGLLLGLLGFALVVQLHSNTGDTGLDAARPEDLVRILSDLNSREDRLRSEIATLQRTRDELASGQKSRQAALEEARRRADELGILAGTIAAQGQGLRITLVPGSKPIDAATVLDAVEELRGAGAEAMQISGANGSPVRIVASTYFIDGPNGLVVDAHPMVGPYTLMVIGPAQTMQTALTIPGGVADTVARDGGNVIVDEPGTVHIDALHSGAELRYAQPVS